MIQNVRLENIWHRGNGAIGVVSVVVSWACNGLAVRYYVNFCLWVLEAQEATRNDWHGIQLVVHASEVRHLVERVRFLSRLIAN